ncbi:ER membrane protein complex subunit 1-like [Oppia nitens]|uniref:ER membrane protein complex subunit 1-like n=1 Tax=Oppia nitens TaxID=1686743 RepID=UPI0023DAB12E|nr:ER membrane protein complex subunit 1-like [Oppia nitens]
MSGNLSANDCTDSHTSDGQRYGIHTSPALPVRTLNMFKLFILSLVVLSGVDCLYEDQVHKFDWRSRYVGHLKDLSLIKSSTDNLWQTHQSVILSTKSQVLTSLYIRNGTIQWRHLLESEIDLFVSTGARDCPLFTINGGGVWLRCWSLDGVIISEKSLSTDFIEEIESSEENFRLFFSLSSDLSQIMVAKFNQKQHSLELYNFDLKSHSLKTSSTPISIGNWFTERTSCAFMSSKYLICVDDRDLVLQYLIVGESKAFNGVPLSSFGLNANTKPKYLRLQTLPHQEEEEKPYFGLDLGGDGFVVLRINQKQIELIKVLAKVSAITLTPVIDTNRLALCSLATKANPIIPEDALESPTLTTGMKIVSFDLETGSEVSALSGQFVLNGHIIIDKFDIIPIIRSDNKYIYKILINTEDSTLIITNFLGRTSWRREEALSRISSAEFMDLPLSELDAKIEQTFTFDGTNILSQFLHRISTQVNQLQTFTANLAKQLVQTFAQRPVRRKVDDNNDEELSDGNTDPAVIKDNDNNEPLVRDKFGLHKVIIALAENGKLFGIDSTTGAVIWSLYEPYLKHELNAKNKLPILVQRTTAHYPFPAQCSVINKNGYIFSFNPITGETIERIKLEVGVTQTMLLSHTDSNYLKPILILDDNLKPIIYPSSAKSLFLTNKDIYFMLISYNSGSLRGLSFADSTDTELNAKQMWSIDLPTPFNSLQVVFKRYGEHVHSQGRVKGDRNVLYKYLNPNLVAIVGESIDSQEKTFVVFYLVDAITGSVIHTTVHKRAKQPIHIVHSENWVIYSFYNEKSRRTEISSVELYEGLYQSNSSAFSSLTRNPLLPSHVEENTFIFPTGIDVMADTVTERGITSKHILIFLPSGGLLELPKAFIDPRRPLKPTPEHMEEGLIPYIPELPIPAEGIINYNKTLTAIRGIQTSPTGLESTCLVFAYGLDLFYTRVTPSKTFDVLKDDFDFILISVVLIALIAFSYATKWLASRKALNASWK